MKDFLFFTKGEKNGLCLLLALVGISLVISAQIQHFDSPNDEEKILLEKEVALFKASLQEVEKRPQPFDGKGKEKEFIEKKENFIVQERGNDVHTREKRPSKPQATIQLEINSADTSDFKKLKGIGSAYSARIVKFREKLGGFYTVEQIKEVYGIRPELYESIRPQLHVDAKKIKVIDLNDPSFTYGFYHPYFPKKGVTSLIKEREKRGRLEKEEVKAILGMEEKDWEKLKQYIK